MEREDWCTLEYIKIIKYTWFYSFFLRGSRYFNALKIMILEIKKSTSIIISNFVH